MMNSFTPIVHDDNIRAMRRFVVVGNRAKASPRFKLDSLGASGGRMDVLVRCVRAAMLIADGVRRDTLLDLLLLGGENAPLTLRLDGRTARFLRPDERRNALTIQQALAARHPGADEEIVAPGITAMPMDLPALLAGLQEPLFVLARDGVDLRRQPFAPRSSTFIIGDDRGLMPEQMNLLRSMGAIAVSLGPTELHTEDAITLVHNELDRRWIE
jgi:tRNA (pseudouridine54-N1)-methyltransferase